MSSSAAAHSSASPGTPVLPLPGKRGRPKGGKNKVGHKAGRPKKVQSQPGDSSDKKGSFGIPAMSMGDLHASTSSAAYPSHRAHADDAQPYPMHYPGGSYGSNPSAPLGLGFSDASLSPMQEQQPSYTVPEALRASLGPNEHGNAADLFGPFRWVPPHTADAGGLPGGRLEAVDQDWVERAAVEGHSGESDPFQPPAAVQIVFYVATYPEPGAASPSRPAPPTRARSNTQGPIGPPLPDRLPEAVWRETVPLTAAGKVRRRGPRRCGFCARLECRGRGGRIFCPDYKDGDDGVLGRVKVPGVPTERMKSEEQEELGQSQLGKRPRSHEGDLEEEVRASQHLGDVPGMRLQDSFPATSSQQHQPMGSSSSYTGNLNHIIGVSAPPPLMLDPSLGASDAFRDSYFADRFAGHQAPDRLLSSSTHSSQSGQGYPRMALPYAPQLPPQQLPQQPPPQQQGAEKFYPTPPDSFPPAPAPSRTPPDPSLSISLAPALPEKPSPAGEKKKRAPRTCVTCQSLTCTGRNQRNRCPRWIALNGAPTGSTGSTAEKDVQDGRTEVEELSLKESALVSLSPEKKVQEKEGTRSPELVRSKPQPAQMQQQQQQQHSPQVRFPPSPAPNGHGPAANVMPPPSIGSPALQHLQQQQMHLTPHLSPHEHGYSQMSPQLPQHYFSGSGGLYDQPQLYDRPQQHQPFVPSSPRHHQLPQGSANGLGAWSSHSQHSHPSPQLMHSPYGQHSPNVDPGLAQHHYPLPTQHQYQQQHNMGPPPSPSLLQHQHTQMSQPHHHQQPPQQGRHLPGLPGLLS